MTLNAIWDNPIFKNQEKRRQREWTEQDLVILREMYAKKSRVREIALKLDRTEGSVKGMAKNLKITNSNKFTREEEKYIKDNMKIKSAEEIAEHLNRETRSIKRKISRIYE